MSCMSMNRVKRYITIIVVLGLVEISLALYLAFWKKLFWNDVQQKDLHGFLVQIGIFTVVALIICLASTFGAYFINLCTIEWRKILNDKTHIVKREEDVENINQRIQDDCKSYPELMLNTCCGLGKAFTYVVVFAISLVLDYNYFYLIIILSYSLISTCIARFIAKPLVQLNYDSQRAEATYRNELTRTNFDDCVNIMLGLAKKTKSLSYFQYLYSQIGVIIPIIIMAPAYFQGSMLIGGLMQGTSMLNTIGSNSSYGIDNFTTINRLISCRRRLKEIGVI